MLGLCVAVAAFGESPKTVSAEALLTSVEKDEPVLIVDVRSAKEYAEGHVPGAVNIPHDEIAGRVAEVKDAGAERVVVYCQSGRRAGWAEESLREAGVEDVELLDGHMKDWRANERPEEK
jgi:rhodanese-related sulfurtransferase